MDDTLLDESDSYVVLSCHDTQEAIFYLLWLTLWESSWKKNFEILDNFRTHFVAMSQYDFYWVDATSTCRSADKRCHRRRKDVSHDSAMRWFEKIVVTSCRIRDDIWHSQNRHTLWRIQTIKVVADDAFPWMVCVFFLLSLIILSDNSRLTPSFFSCVT